MLFKSDMTHECFLKPIIWVVPLFLLLGCKESSDAVMQVGPDAQMRTSTAEVFFDIPDDDLTIPDENLTTSGMPMSSAELEAKYLRVMTTWQTGHISELILDPLDFQNFLHDLRMEVDLDDYPIQRPARDKGSALAGSYEKEMKQLRRTVLLWQYMQYLETGSNADEKLSQHEHEFAGAAQWCLGWMRTPAIEVIKVEMEAITKRREMIEQAAELEKLAAITMTRNEVLNLVLLSSCRRH